MNEGTNYKITIEADGYEPKTVEIKGVRDFESVSLEVDPENPAYKVYNKDRIGMFEYTQYDNQEDMVSFIRGLTTKNGDNTGTMYDFRLMLDLDDQGAYYRVRTRIGSGVKGHYDAVL